MRTDTAPIIRLSAYRPPAFLVPEIALHFQIDPERTRVRATSTVVPSATRLSGEALCLDGEKLELVSIRIDGETVPSHRIVQREGGIDINGVPDQPFTLEIETVINPSANTALMGLYRSGGIYCTQCEAEGFRRITYFPDRPDVLSVYTVRIEADEASVPLLLSNGNPVANGKLGDGRLFAEWHDPHPKPSYLFALVAGRLDRLDDRFTTMEGREVALAIYVEPGKAPLATYAMDALKRSMAWDEERFGLAYDLDVFNIVAVSDFNMGAMENKGLNVFNDKYVLADPTTATDADYANIEAIIAHEYFHNWTGNRITCRDWFQLCLKEGLTVFRDHEFSADMRSRPVKRIAEIRTLMALQYPEDSGPLAHPVRPEEYREINNFYTATVYEKGSEVVRMIRTILGEESFVAGLQLYLKRHDGQAATVEQFIACFEEVSGRSFEQFFLWYRQAGTPQISYSVQHDAQAQTLELGFEQVIPDTPGQSDKQPMHIPITFGLLGPDGQELEAHSDDDAVDGNTIHLTRARQSILFTGVPHKPVVSLLRSLSAPVRLVTPRDPEELAFLARHDTDLVSRWQALNTLLVNEGARLTRDVIETGTGTVDAAIAGAAIEIGLNDTLESAFRALCLVFPSEADIAREIARDVDVDAIHGARDLMLQMLAISARDAGLVDGLGDDAETDAFSAGAEAAGRRALSNALHELWAIAENTPERLLARLEAQTIMSVAQPALTALCSHFPDDEATEKALDIFTARGGGDPLVLDKTLAAIAIMPGDGALNRIRSAMAREDFAIDNPNRVRALIGTFATSNPTGFHRRDGTAYAFFLENIAEIDRRNPQLAARLMTALRSWNSLEPTRRAILGENLRSFAARSDLSRDLGDIVHRITTG